MMKNKPKYKNPKKIFLLKQNNNKVKKNFFLNTNFHLELMNESNYNFLKNSQKK